MSDEPMEINGRFNCDHKCHDVGLNPWIELCPVCGCPNPNYDPKAVSDIPMPPAWGVSYDT